MRTRKRPLWLGPDFVLSERRLARSARRRADSGVARPCPADLMRPAPEILVRSSAISGDLVSDIGHRSFVISGSGPRRTGRGAWPALRRAAGRRAPGRSRSLGRSRARSDRRETSGRRSGARARRARGAHRPAGRAESLSASGVGLAGGASQRPRYRGVGGDPGSVPAGKMTADRAFDGRRHERRERDATVGIEAN